MILVTNEETMACRESEIFPRLLSGAEGQVWDYCQIVQHKSSHSSCPFPVWSQCGPGSGLGQGRPTGAGDKVGVGGVAAGEGRNRQFRVLGSKFCYPDRPGKPVSVRGDIC